MCTHEGKERPQCQGTCLAILGGAARGGGGRDLAARGCARRRGCKSRRRREEVWTTLVHSGRADFSCYWSFAEERDNESHRSIEPSSEFFGNIEDPKGGGDHTEARGRGEGERQERS